MLRFQLYKDVKYFSANYKYFQSCEFKFEMRENILPIQISVKRRQIFLKIAYALHARDENRKVV